ncbi:MAG TPA: hypothetical protein PLX31_18310 [Gemmatimonadaceae bacterium]|jgi:hypothetical protein|nr:hypothetical protein [Gemmatimonadaceae bacterium]HPV76867.1 hypothetical protein [Gemmatimonadaceae bacterium]
MTTRLLGLSALLIVSATALPAQSAQIIDQGSFTITVANQRTGREDFRIEGTPGASGALEYVARATVVFGDRRLTPALHSDSMGAPSDYQIESRGTTTGSERWSGKITRGRVSARINNARGESAKEYIVTDGALILDDDVFHQYYFLARRSNDARIAIVVPRRNAQLVLTVSSAGADRVTIGTKDLEARHIVLTEPSGATRDVWVDAKGRVLKVAIPARNLVAQRDDPPAP